MAGALRYAMIGGGPGSFIGPVHRAALREDALATLVAGAFSRDPEKNARAGEELALEPQRVYADGFELLAHERGQLDFVTVCTPNDSHFALTRAALEAGFSVMCEKPLSLTRAEAEELCELAARRRLVLGVPFTYAGFPMVKLARDLVRRGELGRVVKVAVGYAQGSFRKLDFTRELDARMAWKMDPSRSGPSCVVADIGVHAAHLAECVTGLEITSVLADLSTYAPGNRLDDDASLLVRLGTGRAECGAPGTTVAKGVLTVSKIAAGEENALELTVFGERSTLRWSLRTADELTLAFPFEPVRVYRRNARGFANLSGDAAAACRLPCGHPEGFIEALANHYRGFAAAVRGAGGGDFPTGREGLRTMRLVEAALASARAGGVWTPV